MTAHPCIDLEQQGWRALASGGSVARDFYDRVLDSEVAMLLPGGLRLDDRAAILQSMSGAPWSAYELQDPQALQLTADSVVVAYGVVARRGSAPEYSALASSAYVRREGGWRLAFHQQTPR